MQPEERVVLGHSLDDDDDGVDVENDVEDGDVDAGHGWEHHLQLGLLLRRRHLRIEFFNNAMIPSLRESRNIVLLRIAKITHQFQHLFLEDKMSFFLTQLSEIDNIYCRN